MTTIDANFFDFNNLTDGKDPFQEKKGFTSDNRFFTLKKDKEGNGTAVIRFLPDRDRNTIIQLYKINCKGPEGSNGSKAPRFYNGWSPSSIDLPCPFQETWARLWNEGRKEEAKIFGRNNKFVANILVINDINNPENNGKYFLLEMSYSLAEKLKQIINPPANQVALGTKPKELFNPITGYNFLYTSKKGSNGFINYDSSNTVDSPSAVYQTPQDALDAIYANTYPLKELRDPSAFDSYETLCEKLASLYPQYAPKTESVQVTPAQTAPAQTAPAQTAPAQTAPAQTAPAQTAPAQTAPAQTAPAYTPPAGSNVGQVTEQPGESTPSASDQLAQFLNS